MQSTIQTSQGQIFPNGEGESMYSPEGSLASPSVWPDKEKERMITVTSGLKCSGLYGKSGPLGSLVRMLLESSRWYSPARRLKWGGQASLFGEDYRKRVLHRQEYVIETICRDLEREGYAVQPLLIPACAVGAPHRRDRIWFIARLVTHPNRDRCRNWTNEQKLISECERKDDYCNGCKDGITTYSDGDRHKAREEGERAESCGREYFPQSEKWRDAPERFYGLDGFSRIAADPYGKRQIYGNDQGPERWEKPDERFKTQYSSSIWEKFPTQSPICSGDDGLSGRLDGITFSKWRQESVKAYGNAIVPQVAYEIFKAIELCR